MSIWTCPNYNCSFDKELQPDQVCPLCGEPAGEFNLIEARELTKEKLSSKNVAQKTNKTKAVPKRVKYCPKCGSTKVFWGYGLPQMWSLWECKNCGYKGALILEDGELGKKLREEWKKTVKT